MFRAFFLFFCFLACSAQAETDRGAYLAHIADCAACHMGADGTLSGGRAFHTPFGTIYASNITPDPVHGIGGITDDQFVAALQKGIGRHGGYLYPAMPYTNYTLMTRGDALAIKAYILSLPASAAVTPPAQMRFPFNMRWLMAIWDFFFNPDHRWQADPAHDAAWNRGAYLAEALGHCQQCHTPRNFLQAPKGARAYAGAVQQGWVAYNVTADPTSGIGDWSNADLVRYLTTGTAPGHGPASGPMAEAVSYSLRYLTQSDAQDMALYLKSLPAIHTAYTPPDAHVVENSLGAHLFAGACASCHRLNGTGAETDYGALAGDVTVSDPAGTNIVQILLHGGAVTTSQGSYKMPSFALGYTDVELSALANYTIEHFGQRKGQVRPAQFPKALLF